MPLPRYQANLDIMKNTGYEIVGYARKSDGEKDDTKRVRLLNLMIEKLETRSLVDEVFVTNMLNLTNFTYYVSYLRWLIFFSLVQNHQQAIRSKREIRKSKPS